MGEWKRIDRPDSNNLIINREEGAIILRVGKHNRMIALYDEDQNVIKYYFMEDTYIIKYDEKNNHILINHDEGEFIKIK